MLNEANEFNDTVYELSCVLDSFRCISLFMHIRTLFTEFKRILSYWEQLVNKVCRLYFVPMLILQLFLLYNYTHHDHTTDKSKSYLCSILVYLLHPIAVGCVIIRRALMGAQHHESHYVLLNILPTILQ